MLTSSFGQGCPSKTQSAQKSREQGNKGAREQGQARPDGPNSARSYAPFDARASSYADAAARRGAGRNRAAFAFLTFVPLSLCPLLPGLSGCAQNQPTISDQPSKQTTATEGVQSNRADTHVWIVNAPAAWPPTGDSEGGVIHGLADEGGVATSQPYGEIGSVDATNGTAGVRNQKAGYTQAGIVLNFSNGGTTGAQAATGTQNPNQTVSPSATQKPEASTAVAIPVAWAGGAANAAPGAASGASQTTVSPQQQADARALIERYAQTHDPAFWQQAMSLLGLPPTWTPPAPQP